MAATHHLPTDAPVVTLIAREFASLNARPDFRLVKSVSPAAYVGGVAGNNVAESVSHCIVRQHRFAVDHHAAVA
jgi:hypothetical protein